MYTRRLVPRFAASAPSTTTPPLRTFTTTSPWLKAPALSDIKPNDAQTFAAKQKAFRDNLAEYHRAKKEKDSQSASINAASEAAKSSSSSSSSYMSSAASIVDNNTPVAAKDTPDVVTQGLGSLNSSAEAEAARGLDSASADGKKKGTGLFSSLIHGTEEGREMDREIERSFSQVLARGKYVHSIVLHEVKPDKVDEYVELVGGWYPKVADAAENKVHLVGSWRTEVGDCDTFVHIWEYQRYEGYHASLNTIQHHPDFAGFDKKLKTLITKKEVSLMQEFRFWPTSPPRQLGGVFELRSYTLHPGNLLEWETHWQKGLAARREVMEGVGAWFVQIGSLNEVHHLWQFADLEQRRANREQSWSVPGWGETVHKTVPLIQSMKSRIMMPLPWSPIG
ncbi:nipsnap family protein [Zymoseptoria brevis]|uniref:Nipsnap family protein n=1 Tax=Zymoseptoria brevis TaxID=1047168 RepID=A0A0F4GLX4_9PEZI|nr:nipsnap family protein [Zymoseptoria brevis]